jgi:hypothetical protein
VRKETTKNIIDKGVDKHPVISYSLNKKGESMLWNIKQKIINNLYESELFEPSIGRTAHKAAVLVERIVESKEPRKELKKWLNEQNEL